MAVLVGNTTAGTTADFFASGNTAVWSFVAVASGRLGRITCVLKVGNPTISAASLGIYDDSAGPVNRLGFAPVISLSDAAGAGAFSADLSSFNINIVSGTTYWLGVSETGEQVNLQGDVAGGDELTGGVFPNPAGASGGMSSRPVIYGESVDSGAPLDLVPFFNELAGPSSDFGPNSFIEEFIIPAAVAGSTKLITPDTGVTGVATVTSAVVMAPRVITPGVVNGSSAVTGAVVMNKRVITPATVNGVATVTGAVVMNKRVITPGTVNGVATVTSSVVMNKRAIITATVNGVSTVTSSVVMAPRVIKPATVNGTSTVTATVVMNPRIIAPQTINGVSTVTGAVIIVGSAPAAGFHSSSFAPAILALLLQEGPFA